VLACVLAAALQGCSVERREMQRVRSPDDQVDAVLVRINGGATTALTWNLYLVPAGAKAEGRESFNADRMSGDSLAVSWKAPGVLEIAYPSGTIHHFTNSWRTSRVGDSTVQVELTLRRLGATHDSQTASPDSAN